MKRFIHALISLFLPLGILLSASTAIPPQPKAAASAFVVNSAGDEPDLLPGDDICLTSAGTCTLRAAIQEANGDLIAGPDTITFTVSTIQPLSSLPPITQPIEIDGSGGAPRVQLIGSLIAAVNTTGLHLGAGSDSSVIKALVIRNFTGSGIRISSNNNAVENCYVGTDSTGNAAQPNGGGGVLINLATGNVIGGATVAQRNVISGNNGDGVAITGADATNTVQGNYIGVGANGSIDLGNTGNGVSLGAASNQQIGGSASTPGTERGNVISGNGSDGVEINGAGGATSSNSVQGNLIGTNAAGTSAIRNDGNGVLVTGGANGNAIGGGASGLRNVISGNTNPGSHGIAISGSSGNTVAGNYIGASISGTVDLGNASDGVNISGGSQTNTIGGPSPSPGVAPGNVISGNGSDGVEINGSATTLNKIEGNLIGLQAGGALALRNDGNGILITSSPANTVGGSDASRRNVISANGTGTNSTADGIDITNDASDNNLVAGNYIGTDLSGTIDLGNAGEGININSSADNNTVGGITSTPGAPPGNLISGNGNSGCADCDGVEINGVGTTGNRVQGNAVGLSSDGTAALKNERNGVAVVNSPGNTIGGTATGAGNEIAFNGEDGIFIPSGAGNRISSNSIHSNTGLGIDLGQDGVTPNDAGDSDAGANNLQNFPVLTAAATGSTTVQGTLNSTPGTTFRLEFFSSAAPDPSEHGEAMTLLGSRDVTTSGAGVVAFTFSSTITVTTGHFISATATDPAGNTSEFSKAFELIAPTAIEMEELKAAVYNDGVLIEWRTGFEVDNLGFNLYREQGGRRALINSEIIAGSALLAGPGAPLTAGRSYRWTDEPGNERRDFRYWLEEIDLNGRRTLYDLKPFTTYYEIELPAGFGAGKSMTISDLAATGAKSEDRHLSHPVTAVARPARPRAETLRAQSIVASEAAVKLSIKQEGWYRVTQPELLAAGLSAQVNPRFLQLFVDGREIPIVVKGQTDNRFDPADTVEFYGLGLDTPTTDARVYYLLAGSQPGKRVPTSQTTTAQSQQTSFPYAVQRKERRVYFAALKNGDKENFFGPVITRDGVEQGLSARRIDRASPMPGLLEIALQGMTNAPHQIRVQLNGVDAGTIGFQSQSYVVRTFPVAPSLIKEGDNLIRLIAEAGASDISLIDYVKLTYSHSYLADGDSLSFTSQGKQSITISAFATSAIRVMDVTDRDSVIEVEGTIQSAKQGFSFVGSPPGSGQRRLLAFTEGAVKRPASVTQNRPSSLRQPSSGADFVIITHSDFAQVIEPLAVLRREQGLVVAVVDIEDIYDEFSFGQKRPLAIKDFIFFARTIWRRPPRFLLLVGDATLDPRNYTGRGDSDFVPTKLIDTLVLETASDDWFGDSDDDGVPEVAIGRLPARTPAEASSVIGKIVAYDRLEGSSRVLLVSDRDDGYGFSASSKHLKTLVPAQFVVNEIDRNITDDQTARAMLLQALNSGIKLVNYTGHGASDLWRGNLLTAADGASLTNSNRLALFVSMTCMNGFFHDTHIESLAESLLKARGGAVAVWASSGLTAPGGQTAMDVDLFTRLFEGMPVGEAIIKAKSATLDGDVRRTWILLGDPAMRLR